VTYAPLIDKACGRIDFARPATELERFVRAMQPWPGAFADKDGSRVQVLRAHVDASRRGAPGEVLAASSEGVVVGTGTSGLVLDEIKPAGKAAMSAAA